MRVIGTAGHVDHGKSTLIKRLTGIDPDRLAEEKAREMTIDLGFAWFSLPNDEIVGVVDVPGHRDFIENMLAGIGGIDAVLLIIAADEGVMPQTREHLAILDLIGVERGIVVLTKIDMVDDPEWLDLIELDVQDVLQGTSLHDAPILRVSAHNNHGIDILLNTLADLLNDTPTRKDIAQPRLPIDRVFVLSGFGTVVTGTLLDGTLHVGQEVELQPTGYTARIRGLQSYKQKVDIAYPGSRVAVNLAGIDKDEISRGNVLTQPQQLHPSQLIDVLFNHLPDANRPLKHNAEVKFFTGTSETTARVRLLDDDVLKVGEGGWIQLRLSHPIVVARGDRFIVRYPSPAQTIGGGVVVDPHPARRWKRFQQNVITRLQTQLEGTPAERLAQLADAPTPIKRVNLLQASGYGQAEFNDALNEALANGMIVEIGNHGVLATQRYRAIINTIHTLMNEYHHNFPLRLGIQREEVRSRLSLKNSVFSALIEKEMDIIAEANLLHLSTHKIQFNDKQQNRINMLFAKIEEAPFTPPSYSDAQDVTGKDVLNALIDLGKIVQVQPEIIFSRSTFDEILDGVLHLIDTHGAVTAKMVRDHFDTSRKYAIGLLEFLDASGITKRVGDERIRGKNAPV